MKKRVGILFSGQMRANSLNPNYTKDTIILDALSKHIFNQEFNDKYEYDIFISTDVIDVEKTKLFFGSHLKNINITEQKWFLSPINADLQDYENYHNKFISRNFGDYTYYPHALYQYYRMYISYLMLKNYQQENNIEYDYMMRIRLDARIMQDINILFDYLETTNKQIFIEHEQLMIIKSEHQNVFKLIEYYGSYDENVRDKYGIYLYLTGGDELLCDQKMRYSPEKQFVDHMYYTLLSNNKDYYSSICGIKYPSYNALYREDGTYGYIPQYNSIYNNTDEWQPVNSIEYIKEKMDYDYNKYMTDYPITTSKKSANLKVLFLNHKIKKCGVYQYGTRLFDILKKSEKIEWIMGEIENYSEYITEINRQSYDLIFYNYHPFTMWWLNPENIQKHIKSIGLQHDLVENDIFDVTLRLDTTLPERPNRYNIARPIFENVEEMMINYSPSSDKFRDFIEFGNDTQIPVIGSFGFCFKRKNFDHIVKYVCDNYYEAIIKFVLPNADTVGADICVIDDCYRALTNPNVKLLLYRDFVEELDIIHFLEKNSINIFMYETYVSAGVSSVIDYALSVSKPIAITDSSWFRHIYSEDIDVNKKGINYIMKKSIDVCNKYKEEFSNKNLINRVDEIIISNTIKK